LYRCSLPRYNLARSAAFQAPESTSFLVSGLLQAKIKNLGTLHGCNRQQ
jgi:hypothetical protein